MQRRGFDAVRHWVSHKLDRVVDYTRFFYVQRVTGFTIGNAPEFEPGCLPFFLAQLDSAETYVEFGAGGSTVEAAKRGKRFICVESDAVFLAAVRRKIESLGHLDPARQTFIAADIGLTEAWGAPVLQRATPGRVEHWRNYPTAPWAALQAMPGPYFFLVDGRFRAACALSAARFLQGKTGTILIDDYEGRDYYEVVERHLELIEARGRMRLFKPRSDIDAAALDADIEEYTADWR